MPWQAAIACLSLAACTVGPDYAGPPDAVASGRPFARTGLVAGASVAQPPSVADWWTGLNDPTLDRLEAEALSGSPDVVVATARLRQARAQLGARRAELRPTTSSSAIYLHSHGGTGLLGGLASTSATGTAATADTAQTAEAASSGSSSDFDFYDVGFNASWEIDLFGGRRRAVEAAAANAEARIASLADAQVSLTSDVARAYVQLRGAQARAALARSSAALQERSLALTRQRAAAGTASQFDVERLVSQVEQTRTDQVPLEAQVAESLNQIAILTGRAPGGLDALLTPPAPIPLPPGSVPVGDPAGLLRRRPDVRIAERQLASKNAAIGQKLADYFPKVQLLGNLGFSSSDVGELLTGASFSALVAPVLSWKPFDFGRTAAAVDDARGARDEAEANYRGAVLKALEDAETALSRYGSQRRTVQGLERVAIAADRAASLARQRYAAGTLTLIDQLDTERERVRAEQALAQARADLTEGFVRLQKSLGLGWFPVTEQPKTMARS